MTEQTTGQPDTQPADLYRGVYGQPYNDIVHPARVWTVSKYFLRRWSAYLPPPAIWLVIGARQLSYLNRRRPWFAAYDSVLADAAGLNVDVFRRTLKREITGQDGPLARFLTKESDPAYVVREGGPRKGRTRYTIRLDDPLTPGDAAALTDWMQQHLDPDAGAQEVIAALQEARTLEPRHLWAQELPAEERHEGTPPLTVASIVRRLLPHLDGATRQEHGETTDGHWTEEADALHTHLVGGEIVHLEPHYFREQWLPLLGPGPALLIVTLRSLCYLNEETGDIRDVVRTEAGDLAQRLQTTRRTLRRWFKKLEKAAAHDTLFGPFFSFLENNKQPDQRVIASYRINLKMPLTPDDFVRYRQRMAAADPGGDNASITPHADQADKKSATSRRESSRETDKISGTTPDETPLADKMSVTELAQADEKSAPAKGGRRKIGYKQEGGGQKVATSPTKGRSFKYYKRLLTALNLKDFAQLEQRTEQQYQYLWHVRDGRAQEPLAAVAAEDSLALLLERLNIQEPARSLILQRDPSLAEILAWYLYAKRQSNLDHPLAYVVSRAREGDHPPQPFLKLAALSWEQWRTYAAICAWALHLVPGDEAFEALPAFQDWFALYGGVPPDSLPFQVGAGLASLRIASRGVEDTTTAMDVAPAARSAPGSLRRAPPKSQGQNGADAQLWQEALSELALQMTQSTFDAWLRRSHFVSRREQTWTIAVDSRAAQSWLQNRLSTIIERTLSGVVGQGTSVRFVVDSGEGVAA